MICRAAALFSFLLLVSNPLLAGSNTVDAEALEVITVSATPVSLDEAGSSITLISREQIERRNAATLQDLLREVPGFAVSQQGSLGAVTQVRVRGAEANQVLVLINGIEINDPGQGSEFDFSQVGTQDIERIEIVRGPQSALWGSDALAGVINIITIPAETETGIEAAIEGGSFSTGRARLGMHLASGKHRVKFTVDSLNVGGTNISRTGDEKDGLNNLTLGLTGQSRLSENLGASYTLRHTRRTSDFDAVDYFNSGLPVDADFETDSEYLYGGVTLSHDISDSLDQQLVMQITDTDNATDNGAPAKDRTLGRREALRYRFNAIGSQHRFSVGTEYERESFRQRGLSTPFGDPNQNREAETWSVAAEYRFDGQRFDASASWRQDRNQAFDDANAWRLTGNLQLTDATTLFASAGQSIKNPTFAERFGYYTNFVGNPDLSPEESTGWEIGLRQRFLWNQTHLTVAWFQTDLENEINGFVFDPVTFGFTSANVDGESVRQGLEMSVQLQSFDSLVLRGGYTYLDAREDNAAGNESTEVRRAEHSGYLNAAYSQSRWGLDLAWSYTGTQEDDFFPPYPPYQERVRLAAFQLLSFSAYYDVSPRIRTTVRAENLTNEDYEQVYGYASPGAAVYAGIRVRW